MFEELRKVDSFLSLKGFKNWKFKNINKIGRTIKKVQETKFKNDELNKAIETKVKKEGISRINWIVFSFILKNNLLDISKQQIINLEKYGKEFILLILILFN